MAAQSIRRQSIISSILVYMGALVGVINTYFFVKNGSFTPDQYGLTRIFFNFGQNISAFGSLGIIPVIYKFYPYYKDNLEENEIDLMTWAMLTALLGFLLVLLSGFLFEPLFIAKYTQTSHLIISYYWYLFPFALGMLLFSLIESFCWALRKSVVSNFMKETGLRILTFFCIMLFYLHFISFRYFIYLFSALYFIIFLTVFFYLKKIGHLHFPTKISRVTRKFYKKMSVMQWLIFGGTVITTLATTLDSFLIAGFQNLAAVGVFGLSQYAANLIQIPQRSIESVSSGALSRAWKDKNFMEINRIYFRSSINMLILSLFIFGNLWLNIRQGLQLFNIQKEYTSGLGVIFVLGLARVIDAGTGVNGTIIGTSTLWRFDFFTGIILLAIRIPLTYYLIKYFGITGSAVADLIAFAIYNYIRFEFLRRKFGMQPFNNKTAISILVGLGAFFITDQLSQISGWTGLALRVIVFSGLMIISVITFRLSPDATEMWKSFIGKLLKK